jgi:hypothetical protein
MDFTILYSCGLLNGKPKKTIAPMPRIEKVKDFMYQHYVDSSKLSPIHTMLFEQWEKYLESEKESLHGYFFLVDRIRAVFNDSVYEDLRDRTRFLHRTLYLQEKGLEDVVHNNVLI